MKFTADVREMRSAMQIVSQALSAKVLSPISECVLIEADKDSIKFTCTDLVMQVSRTVEGFVEEPGRCAVRGKMFNEIIRKMPDGDVSVASTGKNKPAIIRAGRAKSQLSCVDADAFPVKDEVKPITTVKIGADALLEMITDTEACIAKSDMREVLNGGCIDVDKCVVRMAALDGFRLAVKGYACSCETDMKAIIPEKSLMILKKILSEESEQLVEMEFSKSEFALSFGNANIICTLISGNYVEWRQIVPKTYNATVRLNASDLKSAVERAYIVAKSGTANNLVRFEVTENTMRVFSKSDLDEMYDEIDVEHDGEPIKIAFNVIYLNDLLKVFSDGDIVLKFVNPISPCVVEYAEKNDEALKDFFWLILPVRQAQ